MFPNWTWLDFLDPLNPKHWWLQWVMSSYLWGLCSFFGDWINLEDLFIKTCAWSFDMVDMFRDFGCA
jgi:hypothetical protein